MLFGTVDAPWHNVAYYAAGSVRGELVANDNSEFRRVLFKWAVQQLEQHSDHIGPFEVIAVRMSHDDAKAWSEYTREDALTDVVIQFRHDGRACPDARKRYYTGCSEVVREHCEDTQWSPMESTRTVAMINELLKIADE